MKENGFRHTPLLIAAASKLRARRPSHATVVAYGALFYFGMFQRGGVYDKLRAQLAVTMLNDAVKDIEFYRLQHGRYPATLNEAEPSGSPAPESCVAAGGERSASCSSLA